MIYLYIFIGGGLGALCRFLVVEGTKNLTKTEFPFGTLVVNVVGSFLIGFILAHYIHKNIAFVYWKPLFVTGFLGGFTTFSAFSYETLMLFLNNQFFEALANVFLSLLLCLLMVYTGFYLGRFFH